MVVPIESVHVLNDDIDVLIDDIDALIDDIDVLIDDIDVLIDDIDVLIDGIDVLIDGIDVLIDDALLRSENVHVPVVNVALRTDWIMVRRGPFIVALLSVFVAHVDSLEVR